MAGWVHVFAAAANGHRFDGDPSAARGGPESAAEFRQAADEMIAGWRAGGLDRSVPMTGSEVPGAMAVNMTLMEYITHGWDLAVATGRPVPYSDDEAAEVLRRAETTLPPQFRGEGKPFGPIVEAPQDAPTIERLAAFMGRRSQQAPQA
jgi:uncharacterized protein (TIGR03086 family)